MTDGGLQADIQKERDHFSLQVHLCCSPGELVCLVGPSGSGKTTVLRCIAGLENLSGGSILFDQEIWSEVTSRIHLRVQKRRVGLLSQDSLLFPHLTVLQNTAFACHPQEDPLNLLASMRIDHLRHKKPHEISGGERQRAALCQVLAYRPRLLLLDEPFSALDLENRMALRHIIVELQQVRKMPILVVTHDLGEAHNLGDVVLPLRDGQRDDAWLRRQYALLAHHERLTFSPVQRSSSPPEPRY
ncbi:MAG: ABC transporter ATP-binding protein [Desulfopila sp.]